MLNQVDSGIMRRMALEINRTHPEIAIMLVSAANSNEQLLSKITVLEAKLKAKEEIDCQQK